MKYIQFPDMVPESEYLRRSAICNSCENKQTRTMPKLVVCILCNCPIEQTNKLKASDCPIGKWNSSSS